MATRGSLSIGEEESSENRPGIEPAFLPALFNSETVAMVACDAAGRITAVSPGAERLLGYTEAQLVGRPGHETLHAHRPDGGTIGVPECPMSRALSESKAADGAGEVLVCRDGSLVTVAWAVAPVVLAGTRTGAMFAFYDPATGSEAARQTARFGAIEAASIRLALLAQVTSVLQSGSGLAEGLSGVARLLVPAVADWVVIDLLDPDTGRLERSVLVHRHPDLERLGVARLGSLPAPGPGAGHLADVLAGGEAVHITHIGSPEQASHPLARARAELFAELGGREAITVPLRTRSRTLGAVTVVRSDARRAYHQTDVDLVSEVAGRAAFAVENAWLLSRQERRAEEMQRALLPDLPDRVGAVELAGVYRPASNLAQVGGDWYDAFELADHSIALVIGDVAGHDLHTATRMGAVRHKLRAIAGDRLAPPSEILTRLDAVWRRFSPDDMVTGIYARLTHEGRAYRLEWANAGHPPPLAVSPDRDAVLLGGRVDPPLGVADVARHDHQVTLDPGTWLTLYTDGLVEHPRQSIDRGLARLTHLAARADDPDLHRRCTTLVEQMGVHGADDVAVLGVDLPPVKLN